MSKNHVITDNSKEVDNDLGNFAQNVYNSLNPNANFTWDASVMPQFQTGITTFRSAQEKVINGTPTDTTAKNVARAELLEKLRIIAIEVNLQANNDLQKLQSSGFHIAKGKNKVGILPKPTGFTVKTGDNSGDLLCNVDANTIANMYNFYSAPVPAPANINDWRLTPSTNRKKNIPGFIPGKQYELKCAYQGSEDTLIYSDSVFIFAQ